MKVQTDLEIQLAAALKTYRAAIRLKHALAADEEIAKTLPEVETRIMSALQNGEPLELAPGKVFDEV